MTLLEVIRTFIKSTGVNKAYCAAFSGGVDSHALLHVLASLRSEFPFSLRAIHIDHGLQSVSAQWALHCEDVCRQLNVPFQSYAVNIAKNNGDSLEEAAREARYAVFSEMLAPDEVLLTAHHEQDQAETLLLQLCRGAGVAGLAAMPMIKPFAKGFHARPLLSMSKKSIHDYASLHSLHYIEDATNLNTNFSRNFMRHDVLPLLNKHYPNVTRAIARSALHCQEANALLDELALELLETVRGSKENTLSIAKLNTLTIEKQKCVLRYWIKQCHVKLPNTKKMTELLHQIHHAANDRFMTIEWDDVRIKKYRDDVYLLRNEKKQYAIPEQFKKNEIRYRQQGDVVFYKGHHRELSKCFQEWGVPPWERDSIPLIFDNGVLVCVPGYFK
jgi:tRNA(Ile)-lysidine synthase